MIGVRNNNTTYKEEVSWNYVSLCEVSGIQNFLPPTVLLEQLLEDLCHEVRCHVWIQVRRRGTAGVMVILRCSLSDVCGDKQYQPLDLY